MTAVWIWAFIFILSLGIEIATPSALITLWFAVGSLVALPLAVLNVPLGLQVSIFVLVSILTLVVFRPLMNKLLHIKPTALNMDRLIGQRFRLDQDLIEGQWNQQVVFHDRWTIASDGLNLSAGSLVEVIRLEGVKLIVHPIKEANHA